MTELYSLHFFPLGKGYLIVTIICGYYILRIFAIWKNHKIKYPQKSLPTHHALWCSTITNRVMLPLWNMHNHSLLIVSAFSFLPSCAITSSRKWRLMTSMIVGVLRAFVLTGERVHAAPCGMFHVDLHENCMYFSPDNNSIKVGFKVELLPLDARSRKL